MGILCIFFIDNLNLFIESIYSVDATKTECKAKYINDSSRGNARMFTQMQDGILKLVLYATKLIPAKSEIRYNYNAPGLWWRKEFPTYNRPFHWDVSYLKTYLTEFDT